MAITPDDLRRVYSEFLLVPDEMINHAILEATVIMGDDVDRWLGQDVYYMAQLNLVAHLAKVMEGTSLGDDNAMGPIRRTEVDNVEIDYAVAPTDAASTEEFITTVYGRRYLMYRKMCFSGWRVA